MHKAFTSPDTKRYLCVITGLLFYFSCLMGSHAVHARKLVIPFQHYTVRNGLSSNILYYIAEDKHGQIWVSSLYGLDRFNGNEFTHFEHNDFKPGSLPAEQCFIINDRIGDIWVYSNKGIAKYDDVNDRFVPLALDVGKDGTISVNTAVADANNRIWFTTEDGWLWCVEEHIPRRKYRFKDRAFNSLFCDSKNRIWIAADNTLIKFENNTATSYRDSLRDHVDAVPFFSLYEDTKGRLWCATWGEGIKLFHPETNTFQTFLFNTDGKQIPRNFATSIIQPYKDKSELWISSVDPDIGIVSFEPESETFSYLNHDDAVPESPAANAGLDLFRDSRGIVWYSCEGGLDKFDARYVQFPSINLDPLNGFKPAMPINALLSVGKQLWIGSYGNGLNIYDSVSKKNIRAVDLQQLHPAQSDLANVVHVLHPAGNNKIFVGTMNGVFESDAETHTTRFVGMMNKTIRDIALDASGRLFYATTQGVYMAQAAEPDIITDTLANATTSSIFLQQHAIWFYAHGSIWKYTSGKLERASLKAEEAELLSGIRVEDISGNGKDELYLATSSGLFVYNTFSQSLRQYTTKNGLQHGLCSKVIGDKDGNVWVLNEKGLSLFNKKTETFTNFSSASGIISPTFQAAGMTMGPGGEIYFGRYISLYHFSPREMQLPRLSFKAVITSLQINDSLIPGSYFLNNKTYFPVKEGDRISIRFIAVNFSNESHVEYEYRLSEKDTQWISAGTNTVLTFPGLEPGTYTFQVRVKNAGQDDHPEVATLHFKIVPPFWRTWWFQVLLLLLAGSITTIAVQWRIRNIRTKANLRHILAEAEIKALRAQMNPHFIFNCLNTIEAFVLQDKQQEASQLIQRFSKLARKILENSRLNYITVEEDMAALRLYLEIEKTRQDQQFDFQISISETVKYLDIPSMIIQPFVENSVLHGIRQLGGTKGLISISAESEGENIKFVVEDNGIGRQRAMALKKGMPHTHRSLGMEVTLERLEAIYNHSRQDEYIQFTDLHVHGKTGTRVEIYIPKKYNYAESTDR